MAKLSAPISLKEDAVLLCENGESITIWVGKRVEPQICFALFGQDSVLHLSSEEIQLAEPDHSELASWVHKLIERIRRQTLTGLYFKILKQGDLSESKFAQMMIQDAQGYKEYYPYFTELHKKILGK